MEKAEETITWIKIAFVIWIFYEIVEIFKEFV
jgi:hypothetical protein